MEHKSDEYQKKTRRTSNIKRRATQSQRTIRTQVAAIASVFRRGPKKVIRKETEIKEVVLKQSDPIRQAEFFLGRLPREEVDLLLSENGQYAVRVSGAERANQSGLCLSVRWNNTNLHIIIMINEKGKYSLNRKKTFEYIDQLVKYYVTEKQTVCQQLGALLIKPVCRPEWIINGSKLTRDRKLGEGNFGEVWSGTLQRDDNVNKVAIKFLKQNKVPSSEELLFYKECRRLRALNHRHVVKFLGVTACEDSLKLIMELCDDGLCNYLRSNVGKVTLTVKGRILMHIARGMEYLANEGIIHRDLAARNCLIKNDIHKISDLGMAREGNLYKMSNRLKPVPIKWTAPDALRTGSYSQAADVWSYGVLIWEVMTDGQAPYADLQEKYGRRFTVRLLELLDEGYRLTLPSNTPSEISAIMANCMEKDAEKRKTFKEIREALEGFHVQRGGTISWSADTTSNKSASSQQTCKATLAVTKK